MPKFIFSPKKTNIKLCRDVERKILHYRQKRKKDKEKGGVILGKLIPSENTLIITDMIASKNACSNSTDIKFDTNELQNIINKKWEDSHGEITYLGDWHTHPCKTPKPSLIDKITFFKNYHQSNFDQNILIYIIFGSDNKDYVAIHNGYTLRQKEMIMYPPDLNQ